MLALLAELRGRSLPIRGGRVREELVRRLEDDSAKISDLDRLRILENLARLEQYLGRERDAIGHLEEGLARAARTGRGLPHSELQLTFRLGIAWMRLGETENCCRRATPDACQLPIRGGGLHTRPEGSRAAIRYFTDVLEQTRPQWDDHRAARWLLNLAHMTLGTYPEGVPAAYRLPLDAIGVEEPFPRFVNIASKVGVDTFSLSGGAVADDFDNDGYLDLMVSTWDEAGQLRFWRNLRNGTFADATAAAGLEGLLGGLNLVQADYDNDGHLDLLVLRGAWMGRDGQQPNSLLHNEGDGTFRDVTFEAGLGAAHYPTQTAAWADYDNDGDLDLMVGNEHGYFDIGFGARRGAIAPCQLFRNNGDGTFTDVAAPAGVRNNGYTKAVAWGDFDGDRFPDLYVSNYQGANRLYRNNRDGTFFDVAPELGVTGPNASFPCWFWDHDNDGDLDLYVSTFAAEVSDLAAHALGEPVRVDTAALYRNDGSGHFESVGAAFGLARPLAAMGANFGDVDGDGYLDFYVGTGTPEYKNLMPNVMFHNRAGTSFADVSANGGFAHLQKGHAVVFADLDNDGDVDVFEQMGGAFPGDAFYDALYENPGFGHAWISVLLVGTSSNRSAIGARIRVVVDGRSIYRHVNSGGSFGANPLRQTIGLGRAERIDKLEVYWPATGKTQVFSAVPVGRFVRIREGVQAYELLDLGRQRLGRK